MQSLAIISFVIGVVSLVLQLTGVAPKWKKHFSQAFFFGLGLTAGVLFNLTSQMNILMPAEWKPRSLFGFVLMSFTGLLIAVLCLACVFLDDDKKRGEARQAASAVSGFLVFLLMFFSSWFFPE